MDCQLKVREFSHSMTWGVLANISSAQFRNRSTAFWMVTPSPATVRTSSGAMTSTRTRITSTTNRNVSSKLTGRRNRRTRRLAVGLPPGVGSSFDSMKRIGTFNTKATAPPARKGASRSSRNTAARAAPSNHSKAVKARAAKAMSSASFFMVFRDNSIANLPRRAGRGRHVSFVLSYLLCPVPSRATV